MIHAGVIGKDRLKTATCADLRGGGMGFENLAPEIIGRDLLSSVQSQSSENKSAADQTPIDPIVLPQFSHITDCVLHEYGLLF